MAIKGFQPSFAGGVLGAGLHGRIDLAKYDVGLRQGVNIFIHTHGGFSNRAGFEYIGDVDDSTKLHKLIPFERDDESNYILVMGNNTMQVVRDGAFVANAGTDLSVATPYRSTDLEGIDFVQSADVMYFAHRDIAPRKMSRYSEISWNFSAMQFNPTNSKPTGLSVSKKSSGSETYRYGVTAVDADGRESFMSASASVSSAENLNIDGAENSLTWDSMTGADHYRIYRKRGGVYGYIGFSENESFTDDNISPNLSDAPPVRCNLFAAPNEYPATVTLSQQRLIYGGSYSEPEGIWGSKIGDYENFTRAKVVKPDDRYEASLSGPSINSVRALLPLKDVIAFGARGEFSLSATGGMDATAAAVVQYGHTGTISGVKPLVVNDTALFVERTGDVVRDLRYAFEQEGYTGNELSILAYHYFKGRKIIDWAYAQSPFSIVWVVLDNGKLLSMTYKREHQVWAWTEHDLGGSVESVATVNEGGFDAIYIVVQRELGGSDRRMVLRLRDRRFLDVKDAFFVDYGITYDGAPETVITGLDHLEGETVMALADGSVIENLVVSSGAVTLPEAASKVHVGIHNRAFGETLPPAIELKGAGASRGRPINVNKVDIQVEETRGIKTGTDLDSLQEYIQTGGNLSENIEPITGLIGQRVEPTWAADGGTLYFVQDYPLPMTVLGAAPEVTVGH